MLDAFKAAGALAGLMKNTEALKASGDRIKARLDAIRVEGSSGGGAVRATVSGDMKLTALHIEPAVAASLASVHAAQAQSLIADAVNDALEKAKARAQSEIAKEAEAMGLGGIPGLGKLLGGGM